MRACVYVRARACMRVCACACMRVCVYDFMYGAVKFGAHMNLYSSGVQGAKLRVSAN